MDAPLQPEPLVLASVSPRRAEMLREAGYRFVVREPRIEEPAARQAGPDPAEFVQALAYFKARAVADPPAGATILAADTVAVVGGEIVGKPADRTDARRILQRLSGTRHAVLTGLALLEPASERRLLGFETTGVVCRRLTAEWIERYLDSGQWRGKAGAYGIQDRGDELVKRIEGSFTNVVGLPLERLAAMFAAWCRRPATDR